MVPPPHGPLENRRNVRQSRGPLSRAYQAGRLGSWGRTAQILGYVTLCHVL
jgi:hypothetical protein